MKNEPNKEPLTGKETFSLIRLLSQLEKDGGIPGSGEVDWQIIYSKLIHVSYQATKAERQSSKP